MTDKKIELPETDLIKVTIIVDNSIDVLMSGSEVAQRMPLGPNPFERPLPIAQHGFSVLIQVKSGSRGGSVMFDTGVSRDGLLYNMDALEIRASDIRAVILSHGHPDHAMGLRGLIDRLGSRNLPLVLHPDAYLERKLVLPNGLEVALPAPRVSDLRSEKIEIIEEVGPSMLIDNMILVSGEIERTSGFEKGFPIHHARRDGSWEPDPMIHDDQCAIVNLKGKGLVIVTGCGHSGIINIIANARRLTGIQQIHAVIGGFHLTGALFEPIIPPTIEALKEINPRYVVPGHCSGWRATHEIARAMPEAFIQNSVGTNFVLV